MEKTRYKIRIAGLLAIVLITVACTPQMADKPEIGAAPTTDQLNFTITPGSDEFHVVLTNTSSVVGIAKWDLGNGTTASGEEAIVKYSLAGDYTIKLTLATKGGTNSISKSYTQPTTDYSIFNDPVTIALSGGIAELNGKTWAMDSMAPGHMSVGPAGSDGTIWWTANPLEKAAAKVLYDDRITFKTAGLSAIYVNHGKSFVKGGRRTNPAYSNPVSTTGDYAVDYPNPLPGTWSIEKRGTKTILKLGGPSPIFPCYDAGARDGEYEIVSIDENLLDLLCTDVDGNAWRTKLIRAGYARPVIAYTVNATEGTDNDVACSLTGITIPEGQSVTGVTWNFGDGSAEVTSANKDAVVHHTFMRKGVYTVTARIASSLGTLTGTKSITLANHNSAYVEFLLNMMVVYNDFSEVMVFPLAGNDGTFSIVNNPSNIYPNKSLKVGKFTKVNNQWANAFMLLTTGYRFDLRLQHIFKVMVYGNAGDEILLKMENTDLGGNAWTTGTNDLKHTILNTNKWQEMEFDFSGVGSNGAGSIVATDIVTDSRFNHDYYNVVRMMINPGNGTGTFTFYFDELSGPHVEGITK